MSAAARLITAAHDTPGVGVLPRSSGEWIEAAQHNEALRAAFAEIFGRLLPHPKRFGKWLSKHCGTYGDLTLSKLYDSHSKRWRYVVETEAETGYRERAEDLAETKREIRADAKLSRDTRHLFREAAKAQEAERERQEAAAEQAAIEAASKATQEAFAAAAAAVAENSRRAALEATAAHEKAQRAEAERIAAQAPTQPASKRAGFPIWLREGRQPTREEWQAHQDARTHTGPENGRGRWVADDPQAAPRWVETEERWVNGGWEEVPMSRGATFSDPGGVVSANRDRETTRKRWSQDL